MDDQNNLTIGRFTNITVEGPEWVITDDTAIIVDGETIAIPETSTTLHPGSKLASIRTREALHGAGWKPTPSMRRALDVDGIGTICLERITHLKSFPFDTNTLSS